ncbi:MAG TPA: hypothetical protein VF600_12565 [Abditibacteriaceae bacterium]
MSSSPTQTSQLRRVTADVHFGTHCAYVSLRGDIIANLDVGLNDCLPAVAGVV